MLRTILEAHAISSHEIELRWDDGSTSVADFRPVIEQGGVFAPMADPAFFAQVSLDPSGRFIAWPGDLDFCADALGLASLAIVGL